MRRPPKIVAGRKVMWKVVVLFAAELAVLVVGAIVAGLTHSFWMFD